MGVRIGDEYAIMTSRILPSGHTVTDRTGLLIVKEVKENHVQSVLVEER